MSEAAIYTGLYQPGLVPYTERYPHLLRASEGELYEFGKDWKQLLGLWVNSVYLLDSCPAEVVVVCGQTERRKLTEHPQYKRWEREFSPGEFYSHTGTKWADE